MVFGSIIVNQKGDTIVEFDFSKLLGRIVEKFGTRIACAQSAQIPESVFYSRLSGKTYFDQEEIYRLAAPTCLDIATEDYATFFFTPKVR